MQAPEALASVHQKLAVPENYLASFEKTNVTMLTGVSSKTIFVQIFPTYKRAKQGETKRLSRGKLKRKSQL